MVARPGPWCHRDRLPGGVLYYAFSVVLAPMQAELGWSRAALSGGLSLALLVSPVVAVPVGRWLDARGPRLLMTVGSCASVAAIVAWSRVQDLGSYYAVWALIGVCMAAVLYEPAIATISVWFRRRRAAALTLLTLMGGLASTIFVPLAAWLVAVQGWRAALPTLAGLLGLLTIAPHALLLRHHPRDLGLRPDGEQGATSSGAELEQPPEPAVSLRAALHDPALPWLAGGFCLFSLGAGIPLHLVAYLAERGYDAAFAASAVGLIGVTQIIGRIGFAPVQARLPPRVVSVALFALQPVGLLALLLAPATAGLLLFVVCFGVSRGADTLVRATLVAEFYGPGRFGSIAGVLGVFVTAGKAVSPLGLRAVATALGTYDLALWSLVVLGAAAAAAVYVGDRRR